MQYDAGLVEDITGLSTTDLDSDIDVITTRTVRCRVPQELRELFVCFGRLNRILAEIGHGDSSV